MLPLAGRLGVWLSFLMSSYKPTLSMKVASLGAPIPPGIQLLCYGPYHPPEGARSLRTMMPEVNMSIVHHMIMFGGRSGIRYPRGSKPQLSPSLCNNGNIMYAWARTGQKTPLGLDFADVESEGDGFSVGPGTAYEWIALQIHYQQLAPVAVPDISGVRLGFATVKPLRPLAVQLMASWRIRIPPLVKMDECVACRVTRSGTAVAWRNHAHRLARDIFSEQFRPDGSPISSSVGLISAMEPQIFRVMGEQHLFSAGDTVLLHCKYDASDVHDRITYMGVDERVRPPATELDPAHHLLVRVRAGRPPRSAVARSSPCPPFAVDLRWRRWRQPGHPMAGKTLATAHLVDRW